jgi:DNA polymerase
MDKIGRYVELVAQRKTCACCPCLTNASTIDDGRLDSDEIGPYSRWQGNLNAGLMVIAQDFADVDGFRQHRGWAGERVQTNLALVELIAEAGVKIQPPRFGVADDQLFFTNAVLCMKDGGMQARVPDSCCVECGKRFLRPTIELVSPKVVVTLGSKAAGAVCRAYELEPPRKLTEVIALPVRLSAKTILMPLLHPSRTVLNTVRSLDEQRGDWREVGRLLAA